MTEVKHLEHVDLCRKTKPELLDLLKRQETLLANEKFVNRLPDRGEKLRKLKQNIEEAICKLESIAAAAQLVQRFNRPITNPRRISDIDDNNDDDDELRNGDDDVVGNVFKTLALNGPPRKIVSTPPVIPSNERSDSESKPASNPLDNPVWTRKLEEKQTVVHERKKLNKSVTESPTQTSESRKAKYFVNGVWIETGVTPPPSKFAEGKAISYQESYRLQTEQAARQSELQIEMSAMNLITRMNLCRIDGGESSVDATSPSLHHGHDINGEEDKQPVTTDDES